MTPATAERAKTGERTLLTSLLLSAPGPAIIGIAVLTSTSATQVADFIRRTAELVALFVSWWVFRKVRRDPQADRARLERVANLTVAGAMLCSGVAMVGIGIASLFSSSVGGNVTLGLVIALLGLLTNSWFWWRYTSLNRQQFNLVLAAQAKLYRAKAYVDLCVTIALACVAVIPTHPVTRYVDAVGSIIVAGYLLYNGLQTVRQDNLPAQRG